MKQVDSGPFESLVTAFKIDPNGNVRQQVNNMSLAKKVSYRRKVFELAVKHISTII